MCKMTRQHFQFIAEVIEAMDAQQPHGSSQIARHFAKHLKRTNPRFNEERFLKACNHIGEHVEDLTSNNDRFVECFSPQLGK